MRDGTDAHGDHCTGATRRTTAGNCAIPRILRQAMQLVIGEAAHGEFGRVGHPDDDRARFPEIGRNRRVARSDVVLEADDPVGIGLALDIDVDLDGDGHAVQLAERRALPSPLIGRARRFDRLRAEIDHDGIERWIGDVHALDMRLHELFRAHASVADRAGGIHRGPLPYRRCHALAPARPGTRLGACRHSGKRRC
jgi:hypothetical protein